MRWGDPACPFPGQVGRGCCRKWPGQGAGRAAVRQGFVPAWSLHGRLPACMFMAIADLAGSCWSGRRSIFAQSGVWMCCMRLRFHVTPLSAVRRSGADAGAACDGAAASGGRPPAKFASNVRHTRAVRPCGDSRSPQGSHIRFRWVGITPVSLTPHSRQFSLYGSMKPSRRSDSPVTAPSRLVHYLLWVVALVGQVGRQPSDFSRTC